MGDAGYKGYAICVADYEEDYLYLLGTDKRSTPGIATLIEEAGGECVRSSVPNAFEDEGDPNSVDTNPDMVTEGQPPFYQGIRDEYRKNTERKNLPIMRVKVTVKVETLTDDEAGKVWEDHVLQLRKRRGATNG